MGKILTGKQTVAIIFASCMIIGLFNVILPSNWYEFIFPYKEPPQEIVKSQLRKLVHVILDFEKIENKPFSNNSWSDLIGRYLNSLPVDPWGTPFSISLASKSDRIIFSCGPDKQPGSSDDFIIKFSSLTQNPITKRSSGKR